MANYSQYHFQIRPWVFMLLLSSAVFFLSIFLGFKDKLIERTDLLSESCKGCNIVIIDIDTLRADAIDCEDRRDQTPNLCRVMDRSVYFSNNISHSDFTPTSLVSTITSLYPRSHTFWSYFDDKIEEEIKILPSVLQENGYTTIFTDITQTHIIAESETQGSITKSQINPWFGKYEQQIGYGAVFKLIKDLSSSKKPFFLFVFSWALHAPYFTDSGYLGNDNVEIPQGIPKTRDEFESSLGDYLMKNFDKVFKPEIIIANPDIFQGSGPSDKNKILDLFHKYEGARESEGMLISGWMPKYETYFAFIDTDKPSHIQFLRSSYLGVLKEIDAQVGQLLQILESPAFNDNTILVIKSDHGEEFYEHGKFSHQNNLYQELIHTPLIIKNPTGSRIEVQGLTQDIDVMPTILDILGLDVCAQTQGKSLVPLMENPRLTINDYQIAQKGAGDYISVFRKGEWKLIMKEFKPIELYNLSDDPQELNNLINKNPKE